MNFYRQFNQFIGEYLLHQYEEERTILPTLAQHFSHENLVGVMIAFMTFRQGHDPEKVKGFIGSVTQSLTATELGALFDSMKTYAPPPVFQNICEFSKEVFKPEIWSSLEKGGFHG